MNIRPEAPDERAAVLALTRQAFGGAEEAGIIARLDAGAAVLASLVAIVDGQLRGHILFSPLAVEVEDRAVAAAALAPMCVAPAWQRRGIGAALVEAGIAAMRARGEQAIIVVGHETFYPRFGFSHDVVAGLACAFRDLPAFMGLELVPGVLGGRPGTCAWHPAFGV
jgi:putative acetyltransferase